MSWSALIEFPVPMRTGSVANPPPYPLHVREPRQMTFISATRLSVDQCLDTIVNEAGLRTLGWRTLDARGVGCGAGDLLICAGRTGHGKTAVLANILVHWLESHPTPTFLVFSCELPAEQVFLRMLSIVGRRNELGEWSYADLKHRLKARARGDDGGVQADDGLDAALERVRDLAARVHVVYQPDIAVDRLGDVCRSYAEAEGGLGGIFVDYLQLIGMPAAMTVPPEERVQIVSRRLKALAVELSCPVVTAAQIHSSAAKVSEVLPHGELEDEAVMEAIGKRRPQLHQLGQGGGEQEADMVIGLLNYQADYLAGKRQIGAEIRIEKSTLSGSPYEVTVIKNRHGELGSARLVLEATTGYLRDPGVFGR